MSTSETKSLHPRAKWATYHSAANFLYGLNGYPVNFEESMKYA